MTAATLRFNPAYSDVFLVSFADELNKIAADTGLDFGWSKLASHDPEAFLEMMKEANIFSNIASRLRQYGGNISAYARRAKEALTGGEYARQMKELGVASPMTSRAGAGSLMGTVGPMREKANLIQELNSGLYGPVHVRPPAPVNLSPAAFGLGGGPAAPRPLAVERVLRGPLVAEGAPLMAAPRVPVPPVAPPPIQVSGIVPTPGPIDFRQVAAARALPRLQPVSLPTPSMAPAARRVAPGSRPDIFAQAQAAYA